MAKAETTQSQMQLALNLAKANAATAEARREGFPLNRADLARDPQLRDNRRAMESLLASYAVKSGLDLDRFEQINSKNQADLRRVLEAKTAAAVKRSPSTMQALHQQAARQRKVLEYRAANAVPATSPAPVVLETPIIITANGGLGGVMLDNTNIEPWNSWAKIRVENSGDTSASDNLNFCYMWVNPDDAFETLINVSGFIGANGFVWCASDGAWYPGNRQSGLSIGANLAVLVGSSSIPETGPYQPMAPYLSTNTGSLFSSPATDSWNVDTGNLLELDGLIVSPGESVLIQVVLSVSYFTDSGYVKCDFSSGDFNVFSSFAAVTIVSSRRHPPPRVDG
jgi:hypothetical protein